MSQPIPGFECLDCGVNTAAIDEYYMLETPLWLQINPAFHGMLCLGCAEKRLGRFLCSSDFSDAPINRADFNAKSPRFAARLVT